MATPVKWGSELPVNTTTQSTQDQPSIAALSGGRFVTVWRDISRTGGDASG
jgi:large repetitive protein